MSIIQKSLFIAVATSFALSAVAQTRTPTLPTEQEMQQSKQKLKKFLGVKKDNNSDSDGTINLWKAAGNDEDTGERAKIIELCKQGKARHSELMQYYIRKSECVNAIYD